MKKPIVYIAGAVKGLPFHQVRKKFADCERMLNGMGYEVANPVEEICLHNQNRVKNGAKPLSDNCEADRLIILKNCFAMINYCDCIYFMPCADNSEGANKERIYAKLVNVQDITAEVNHGA